MKDSILGMLNALLRVYINFRHARQNTPGTLMYEVS